MLLQPAVPPAVCSVPPAVCVCPLAHVTSPRSAVAPADCSLQPEGEIGNEYLVEQEKSVCMYYAEKTP